MSLIVPSHHRRRFQAVLDAAARLEGEVFGAPCPVSAGRQHDDLVQVVNFDAAERVIASVRIAPGAPACDRLADRIGASLPRPSRLVELSGLCADPRLAARERQETLLELRASIGLLFRRYGWTHAIGLGQDRDIQFFILSGLTVKLLGPPALQPGDGQLSFAFLACDPEPPERVIALGAGRPFRLQDPDQDPSLFNRYGDRVVA